MTDHRPFPNVDGAPENPRMTAALIEAGLDPETARNTADELALDDYYLVRIADIGWIADAGADEDENSGGHTVIEGI